jgi:hypothetical protein
MIRTSIAALALVGLVAGSPAHAYDTNRMYDVAGYGLFTCDSWTDNQRLDTGKWNMDVQWVAGYLSSVGDTDSTKNRYTG